MSARLSIAISTISSTIINISVCSRNSALSCVVLQNVHVEALTADVATFGGEPVVRAGEPNGQISAFHQADARGTDSFPSAL